MRDSLDNVAHDLRTPLTRLQAGAQLALQHEDPAQIKEALADAVEEAERLNAMLCTIMDISEVQAGALKLDLQTFPLKPVVDILVELYDEVAQEKNITVIAAIDPARRNHRRPQSPPAPAQQPPRQRPQIHPQRRPRRNRRRVSSDQVRITVRDTGIGIDADDLPRIWDRLYRADKSRSQRGLGLGLSLIKAFVEAHGGTANVTSQPGHGSLFLVTFPRKKPTA